VKLSWQDQDIVERRVASTAFSALTDSIVDTQSAIKVLSVTVTAEIGALVMIYVSKGLVYEFLNSDDNIWIYAGIGVFLVGFFTAFAVIRLLPRNSPGIFYAYTIWFFSIAAGIANVGLFYLLLYF
jgi:hypothetical protein